MRDSGLLTTDTTVKGVQSIDWGLIGGLSPHKIFLWDRKGTYLDCEFPNPIYGHFLGGMELLGSNIADVLPPNDSLALLRGIHQAIVNHRPTIVRIDMAKKRCQSLIRVLPLHEFVLGWVNDFPIHASHEAELRENHKAAGQIPQHLTVREWQIANLVAQNKSNQAIAQQLNISGRTVKFHVSHVLKKLHVTRRSQVQTIIPLLHQGQI